jgi:phosphocarrier protein
MMPKCQRKVQVTNPSGFHMRPLTAFARRAQEFVCDVHVTKDDQRVNGKSPLELMLLAAEQGSELLIETSGPDAQAALDALAELVNAFSTPEDSSPESHQRTCG